MDSHAILSVMSPEVRIASAHRWIVISVYETQHGSVVGTLP